LQVRAAIEEVLEKAVVKKSMLRIGLLLCHLFCSSVWSRVSANPSSPKPNAQIFYLNSSIGIFVVLFCGVLRAYPLLVLSFSPVFGEVANRR
jgi:hypothetical protein